jgi:16S rRNA (guanine527-N7)-methyltransferase
MQRLQLLQACEQFGLTLTDAQVEQLLGFARLLLRWNRVYNLTALSNPGDVFTHHLLDCLAVLPPLRRHSGATGLRILDVGSGGGLPGAVLAIAEPAWRVTCVDTVAKKVAFVRQVGAELGLANLEVQHSRVEDLPIGRGHDLIISRAFASLADFVSLSVAQLAPDGVWVAMKGKPGADELGAVPAEIEVFHVEPLAVPGLDGQRCLVWMRHRMT